MIRKKKVQAKYIRIVNKVNETDYYPNSISVILSIKI